MKRLGSIMWGIAFLAVGTIWALNALDITSINVFFRGWWTLFIIVPCTIGLVTERSKVGNLIGLLIGLVLFTVANGWIDSSLVGRLLVPVIFVIIGLTIIFRDAVSKKISGRISQLNKKGLEEYYATFSGQNIDLANEEFKGASVNAIFGGLELDLRQSEIKGEQVINASAIFGGIEIFVPTGVNVKVKSTPIFGGVGNKAIKTTGDDVPTIYVDAFCLFGGVDIK